MIEVTDQAAAYLKMVLDSANSEADQVIRLEADPLRMVLDIEREEDQVVKHEGVTVMVIGLVLSSSRTGNILDVKDTPEGSSLTLRRAK